MLTSSAAIPLEDGQHGADRCVKAGRQERLVAMDARRLPVRIAGDGEEAAHRQRAESPRLVEAVRPGLTERRDAGHGQARSAGHEIRISETAPRHEAGPFPLDY